MSKKDSKVNEYAAYPLEASTPQDPYVIGIGASAGGLQALDALFDNVPRDSVSYVIVQHLSPEHRGLLRDLLSRHKALKFRDAEHDQVVEINSVYVLPPGKQITIQQNRLQVMDRTTENVTNRTIDTFFKSLAEDKGSKAIGVILSGTGSDGTQGIKEIKKAQGMVLVQDPETAKFDGMPRNAINSGYVDHILPPELMPDEIFNYVKVNPLTELISDLATENEPSFQNILELVRERSGVDFINYKRPTIIRRITRRMAVTNSSSLLNYLDYLQLHAEEVETLAKEFLIGVTKFFRDAEAFEIIGRQVIPTLVEDKNISDQLRIWVAGCSSGEEAYSLAILVREYLDSVNKELEVKIFASDIDRDALDFASKALYPEGSLSEISPERRNKFFVPEEGKFRITQRVRRMVIFAPHNLINDPPFSKVDLVSCRNMLIYLTPQLQKKVITKFHYALQLGGYLFLGPSESLGDLKAFAEVHKKWKIFRNTVQARSLGMENFVSSGISRKQQVPLPLPPHEIISKNQGQQHLANVLNETILEEFAYAAVYIDENYDVIGGYGDYTRYLTLPARQLTFNLLKLVPSDLALQLGTILRQAVREKEKITTTGLQIRENNQVRHINVVVKPYLKDKKNLQPFILVLFNEAGSTNLQTVAPPAIWDEAHYETRVHELEIELQHTKEDLQSVVEELETANEELQSTNEELLSSNEELQSTNEELQSLNEELHTVNSEHQYKIKALMELDDDLNNFFRSTDIGQIFVDRQLIIRKFTPAATHQINLIDSDIGRSIHQISNNILHEGLIRDIQQVIEQKINLEREIQHENGLWYQLRILPYLSQEKGVEGAIIIFIPINELKTLYLMQAGILDSSPNAILSLKAVRNSLQVVVDFECTLLNKKAETLLGINDDQLLSKPLGKRYPALLQQGLFEHYLRVIETGETLDLEQLQLAVEGNSRWIRLTGLQLDDGLVLTLQDITARKTAEQQLLQQQEEIRQNVERFRVLLEAFPHITWTNLPDGSANSFNNHWHTYTGLDYEASCGQGWITAFHPEEQEEFLSLFRAALKDGTIFKTEIQIRCEADGEYRWHLLKAVPCHNQAGDIYMWVGTGTDIHEQKEAEEANIQLRLTQQKKNLKTVLQTQEAERKRISEALHNGLGQLLYAAKLNLDYLEPKQATQKEVKEQINNLLDQAIASTRNISFELTPAILRDFGLKTAFEELITRLNSPSLKITYDLVDLEGRFDDLVEISLYRIIQELLNNIMKHSGASEAHLEMENKKGLLYLRVQDNGTGFNLAEKKSGKGIGLSSIYNRVKLLDGKIKIDSRAGQGTSIEITLRDRPNSPPPTIRAKIIKN
ncbi:MAG: chemotaxis protein [Adhaeribacter sp.]|nr:chemotaxis protein [Adhaeribacter sp.]